MSNLPEPVTYEQMFLAAILAELRAIRRKTGRVVPQRPGDGDEQDGFCDVELIEPHRKKRGR